MCCTTQFINPICYTQRTSSVQYSGRAKSHQCQINKLVQCDSLIRFNKWIKTHTLGLSTCKVQVCFLKMGEKGEIQTQNLYI